MMSTYLCPECHKAYKTPKNLYNHLKRKHAYEYLDGYSLSKPGTYARRKVDREPLD